MAKKMSLPPEVAEFFRKQGSIGGKRSLQTMTAEERTKRAKAAVAAREAKRQESTKKANPKTKVAARKAK